MAAVICVCAAQLGMRQQRRLGAALLVLMMLALATGMDEEMAELAKMLHDNCGEETGADLSVVTRINAGEDFPPAPDPKFKCYLKCVMETAGMMSEGTVDVEAVLALLPPELSARNGPALRACGTRAGADDCDTAFLTQVCWQQANKKDFFLI